MRRNEIAEALGNIRTALLLFLIDVHILGFDIIPDFIGWLCLLVAIDLLEESCPAVARVRTFGKVMLGYELVMIVLGYIGQRIPFYTAVLPFVGVFMMSIRLYFMYVLLTAVVDAAAGAGGEEDSLRKLRRSRDGVLLAELAVHLGAAVRSTADISGWLWVPTAVYFICYIGCILRLTVVKEEVETAEKAEKAEMETE